MLPIGNEVDPWRMSLRIAAIYMFLGTLWILLSDKVVQVIAADKEMLTNFSIAKGWFYVLATGVIIFGLIYAALKRIQADGEKLMQNYQELAATHEELTASEEDLRQQFELVLESQKQLHYLAYYEQLTALPNRVSLYEHAVLRFLNGHAAGVALLFIDIDNFKLINDTLGHAVGDQVIKLMGERLKGLLGENDLIYRLGGDEFVILMAEIREQNDVQAFAEAVLAGFKEPFYVGDSILHINISFGIAVFPEHGANIDELLRCADIAMYKAKEEGGNGFVIYQPLMNETIVERMNIEKQLRTALDRDEFVLYFQPQYDLKTLRITGLEALLRWNNRELGVVSPAKFIKIAEETHLIIPLGQWVMRKACQFIRRLQERGLGDLTVSVNVSILQLLQNDFADSVFAVLEACGLKPRDLEIEITESVLMESYESIAGNLERLRRNGVRIALDDFGKGYSSLSYLAQLPITTLKIDKSFIDIITAGDGASAHSKALTGQIVMLGRSMGMAVVAEGVETREQLDYLMHYQCDIIQGYLLSKPLPEVQAEDLVLQQCNEG